MTFDMGSLELTMITDELLDEIMREIEQCDEDIHANLSGEEYADAILADL